MPIEAIPVEQRIVPDIPLGVFGGQCHRCGNSYDVTYYRRGAGLEYRLCIHCIQLEETGVKHSGQGGGRRGADVTDQLNQPTPSRMFSGDRKPCSWCARWAEPEYTMYGHRFRACGWACAGMYMDWVIDTRLGPLREAAELAEGEAYVLQSLGITDAAAVHQDQASPQPDAPDDAGARGTG